MTKIKHFIIFPVIPFLIQTLHATDQDKAEKYDGFSYGYSTTVVKTYDAGSLGPINQYSDGSFDCPPGANIDRSAGGTLTITTGVGSYVGDPPSKTYTLKEKN